MRIKKTLITDINWLIKGGATVEELNTAIADYLGTDDPVVISQWRVTNYALLRKWAYPSMESFLDAQVKIAQGGSAALEGQAQLNIYTQACYSVKLRFPKI